MFSTWTRLRFMRHLRQRPVRVERKQHVRHAPWPQPRLYQSLRLQRRRL